VPRQEEISGAAIVGITFSVKVFFLEAGWRYGALPASTPDS